MMTESLTPARCAEGGTMKKIFLLLVLAAFAAAPAAAAPKKKAGPKSPQQMTFDEAMAYNKKNLSLVVQGLPLVLPSWAVPIYFSLNKDQDKPKQAKKAKQAKKKQAKKKKR
jgi:hypothetical protein